MSDNQENNEHVEEVEEKPEEVEEVEDNNDQDDSEDSGESKSPAKRSNAKVYTKADVDRAVQRRQEALKEKRALEAELKELRKKTETDAEKAAREHQEAIEAAKLEAANKYKPVVVKNFVEKELISAGVKPNRISRLVKLMDMSDIEVDDKFNVLGVEEQIEELREEYPELFTAYAEEAKSEEGEEKPKPKKRRAPRADAADKPSPKMELTANEKLMAQLRGRR